MKKENELVYTTRNEMFDILANDERHLQLFKAILADLKERAPEAQSVRLDFMDISFDVSLKPEGIIH